MLVAVKGPKSSIDISRGYAIVYYRNVIPSVFQPYAMLMLNDFKITDRKDCYDENSDTWNVEQWELDNTTSEL